MGFLWEYQYARELVVHRSRRELFLITQECREAQQVNTLDVLKVRLVTGFLEVPKRDLVPAPRLVLLCELHFCRKTDGCAFRFRTT